MADTKGGDPITFDSDASKSPQDLADEIAQTAANLGGKSPKEKDQKPASRPSKETAKKDDSTTKDSPKINVDGSHKIAVKTKPEAKPEVSAENEEEPKIERHSAKTIMPLSSEETSGQETKDSKQTKPEAQDKPVEKTTKVGDKSDNQPKKESVPNKKDEPEKSEAAHKLDAISGELRARVNEKKAAQEKEQQTAKIYDTKKYHLPIKPGRHHRKTSMPMWGQVLILVIAVACALVYALATDIISFGRSDPSFLTESEETALAERPIAITDKSGVSVVDLIDNSDKIGSANAKVSLYYGAGSEGELISQDQTLIQNQAGSFWIDANVNAVTATNNQLRSAGVTEADWATTEQSLNVVDVLGMSRVLSSNGPVASALTTLEGDSAQACQTAYQSALESIVATAINKSDFEKFNSASSTNERDGAEVTLDQFSIRSDTITAARSLINSAIESCVDEANQASVKAQVWQDSDIIYAVASYSGDHYLRVINTSIERTIIDMTLSNINQELSEQTPSVISPFNSSASRLLSVVDLCGNTIPQQLIAGPAAFSLVATSDQNYQQVPNNDRALVCPDSIALFSNLSSSADLITRAKDTLSIRSLIELYQQPTTGFPSASELDGLLVDLDGALPTITDSKIYSYVVKPDSCGVDTTCESYILNVAN